MIHEQRQQDYNPMTEERIRVICGLVEPEKNVLCIGCRNNDYITKNLKMNTMKLRTLDIAENTDIMANLDSGIPLKPESFEYIVAGEVIEHLYDTDFILSEINRVLIKGGFLVLSVPNICSLRSRVKMLFGGLPVACAKTEHVRDFNCSFMKEFLIKNKFKVVQEKSDGVWVQNKNIVPSKLCPVSFGEHIIIKAKKVER